MRTLTDNFLHCVFFIAVVQKPVFLKSFQMALETVVCIIERIYIGVFHPLC